MIRPHAKVSVADVSKHYNDLDGIYRAVWSEHLHHGLWHNNRQSKEEAVRNLVLKVVETAEIRPQAKVCDVGCGYGATSRMLAREFQSEVLGLTVSESQLRYALSVQSQPQETVAYLNLDWLKNDLESNSFDHIISIESSEHMPSLEGFFQEAYRVLKPGGSFVICAWLTKNKPSDLEVRYLLEPICSEGRLVGMGTPSEYCEIFDSTGFEQVTHEDLSSSVKKTWSLSILGLISHMIKNPKDLSLLSATLNPNRNFLASLFRIRLAYEIGAMKYGIFSGIKPKNDRKGFRLVKTPVGK
jgi:tocopherol O-methyltransferase